MVASVNGLQNGEMGEHTLRIIIVGCGLGGLACAIACRREGLEVVVLEKAHELSEIGAGIQLPPNACHVMSDWDLMGKLYEAGGGTREDLAISRWADGKVLTTRPGNRWQLAKFGHPHLTMHRADYQRVLADEARRLGAQIRVNADVVKVDCNDENPKVFLASGEELVGDVVVGADGLRSVVRTSLLGTEIEPKETGDLAYRITIPRSELENDTNPFVSGIVNDKVTAVWWGPNMHCVLYSIRADEMANLVLICPDNLPTEVAKQPGDLAEMNALFEQWDPKLRHLISKVDKALKWKVFTMDELEVWIKGAVALLGDSCHPSVPYAGSGAAMAVEDAAVLGRLLGLFNQSQCSKSQLPNLMRLYQNVRKKRAETTRQTANENRTLYHMPDGPQQEERDEFFATHDWWDEDRRSKWLFTDISYLHELFGFDTIGSAEEAFLKSEFNRYKQD